MTRSRFDGPDVIAPVSTLGEIESRVGIPTIESLLAERDTLVKEIAPLRARHGPFGVYGDLRKVQLAQISERLRAHAVANGTKVTEASLDQASHAHPEYVEWVTAAVLEKARYFEIENRIDGIADLIQRGTAMARFVTAEVGLAR